MGDVPAGTYVIGTEIDGKAGAPRGDGRAGQSSPGSSSALMFIELTDHLRCPADHEESYLVLLPDRDAGALGPRRPPGLPGLRAHATQLQDGVLDLGGGATALPRDRRSLTAGGVDGARGAERAGRLPRAGGKAGGGLAGSVGAQPWGGPGRGQSARRRSRTSRGSACCGAGGCRSSRASMRGVVLGSAVRRATRAGSAKRRGWCCRGCGWWVRARSRSEQPRAAWPAREGVWVGTPRR